MNWNGLACLLVVVLGIVLFLYGANYYNNVVGWTGVFFFFGGIVAYVLLWVSSRLSAGSVDQNP